MKSASVGTELRGRTSHMSPPVDAAPRGQGAHTVCTHVRPRPQRAQAPWAHVTLNCDQASGRGLTPSSFPLALNILI